MAWIESHQEIGRHPKTRKLARQLNTSVPAIVGHLHLLWHWCLDFADDGNLSEFGWDEIADGALWEEDARTFVQALIDCGWLDADEDVEVVAVHDWDVYTGRIQAAREANRERQKRYRERNKPSPDGDSNESNANVTVMKPLRNGATVPNRTVPNQTVPKPNQPDEERASAPSPTAEPVVIATAEMVSEATFVGDDLSAIIKAVARSFELVPDFDTRDGPFEAGQWAAYYSTGKGKKNQPVDWVASFRNWLKKAVQIGQRDQPRQTGGTASTSGEGIDPDVQRRGYDYDDPRLYSHAAGR